MPKRAPWFSITNSGTRTAEIALRGVIGLSQEWGEAGSFKEFIRELNALGELDQINLSLHSPGGQVFEGLPIYNALKQHPARVVATVEGLAGSIASVILMAADERRIPRNAYVMIHNAEGIAMGDARTMQKMADDLGKFSGDIAALYAARTGIEQKKVQTMMDDETWMNGEDAIANGFADTLLGDVALSNLARFPVTNLGAQRVPAAALGLFDTANPPSVKPPSTPPPQTMTEAEMKAAVAQAEADKAEAEKKLKEAEDAMAAAEKAAADAKAEADKQLAAEQAKTAAAEKAAADAKAAAEAENKSLGDRLKKIEDMAASGVLGASKGAPPVTEPGSGGGETKNLSSLQLIASARTKAA